MSNLRILSRNTLNAASSLTSTGVISGFPVANLLQVQKSLAYRQSVASNTITVIWPSMQTISAIVLAYNNLSSTATYRVQAFNNETNNIGNRVHDSGNTIVPADNSAEFLNTRPTHYLHSYGNGKVSAIYIPRISTVRRIDITITDISNPHGFVEISSLVVGDTWSPVHNTQFDGLSVEWVDNSRHIRTAAGNLVTDISTVNKKLSFQINYLTPADRTELVRILRQHGMRDPIFVSLFPLDSDRQREQDYQIYGKLEQNPVLQHPIFTIYAASISILEV